MVFIKEHRTIQLLIPWSLWSYYVAKRWKISSSSKLNQNLCKPFQKIYDLQVNAKIVFHQRRRTATRGGYGRHRCKFAPLQMRVPCAAKLIFKAPQRKNLILKYTRIMIHTASILPFVLVQSFFALIKKCPAAVAGGAVCGWCVRAAQMEAFKKNNTGVRHTRVQHAPGPTTRAQKYFSFLP